MRLKQLSAAIKTLSFFVLVTRDSFHSTFSPIHKFVWTNVIYSCWSMNMYVGIPSKTNLLIIESMYLKPVL